MSSLILYDFVILNMGERKSDISRWKIFKNLEVEV